MITNIKKITRYILSFLLLSVLVLTGCKEITDLGFLPETTTDTVLFESEGFTEGFGRENDFSGTEQTDGSPESSVQAPETVAAENSEADTTETTEAISAETTEASTAESSEAASAKTSSSAAAKSPDASSSEIAIEESGFYYSAEEVALYLHTYDRLPDNYITKKEAEQLGWSGGSVEPYKQGAAIGGDRFGNYEEILPQSDGRKYYECDIDTLGERERGAKRLVYSNDGLIYYTEDHYKSYTQLYGGGDGQ